MSSEETLVKKHMDLMKKLMRVLHSKLDIHKDVGKMSLDRWFKEKWVDVKTGKPCGRQKEKNGWLPCLQTI